jgi:predicted RNA binding protein YcfA (HicA-like mRNA interferase family)
MDSRDVQRTLEAAGFALKRQRGSHMRFKDPDGRAVTVQANRKDIPVGTLKAIEAQSGVKLNEGRE